MTATVHRSRWDVAARLWKRNASLVVILAVLVGVAYLFLGIPRDQQSDISDSMDGWRGDTARGLFLAYGGMLLIAAAQAYTIVKRVGSPALMRTMGGPGLWLNIHIALSVIGFAAVLLHAGFPYDFRADRLNERAFAGLATVLLLVTTVSGVFGRYLYRRLPAWKRVFGYWKQTHLVVTVLFFLLALVHILRVEG